MATHLKTSRNATLRAEVQAGNFTQSQCCFMRGIEVEALPNWSLLVDGGWTAD